MANARAYPSSAFIKKMIDLAREKGLDPGGFEVAPGGIVRVLPKAPAAKGDLFSELEDRL